MPTSLGRHDDQRRKSPALITKAGLFYGCQPDQAEACALAMSFLTFSAAAESSSSLAFAR